MGRQTRKRIVGSRLDAELAQGVDGTGTLPRRFRPLLWCMGAGGLALAGMGLFAGSGAGQALLQLGSFLAVYAGVVALSLLPSSALGERVDAFLERWVKDPSAGFYGMMALASFLQLELRMFVRELAELELGAGLVAQAIVRWLIGFSVESFVNMLWAMVWPVRLLVAADPVVVASTVALAWLAYWQVGRRLPVPGGSAGG